MGVPSVSVFTAKNVLLKQPKLQNAPESATEVTGYLAERFLRC